MLPVSCNFSRAHMANEHFVDTLVGIVDTAGVARGLIEVEITESVAMESLDTVQMQFERLKKAGFSIAIDDFGTGYSSLGILAKLPVDVIKIDRSFIMGLNSNPNSRKLLAGIVSIVASLERHIVCEGVEKATQLALLRDMGCRVIQGFCYGRPMPPEAFAAFAGADPHEPEA